MRSLIIDFNKLKSEISYHNYTKPSHPIFAENWDGWFISWFDDEGYLWGSDISRNCGFGNYSSFKRKIVSIFGGYEANGNICLPSKEIALQVVDWVESILVMEKLSNCKGF